jgi:hypothetical protein
VPHKITGTSLARIKMYESAFVGFLALLCIGSNLLLAGVEGAVDPARRHHVKTDDFERNLDADKQLLSAEGFAAHQPNF